MAKKKTPKQPNGEPFMFGLTIDGEEIEIPIDFQQALLLYNSLAYYIRTTSDTPEFLN